jgi:hypothetical protein
MAGSTLPSELSSTQAEQGVLQGQSEEETERHLLHDMGLNPEISIRYPIRMGGSQRTSESGSCRHLLPELFPVGECARFAGHVCSDNGMPESVALPLTRTWVVWGERESPVVHVAITQGNRKWRVGESTVGLECSSLDASYAREGPCEWERI